MVNKLFVNWSQNLDVMENYLGLSVAILALISALLLKFKGVLRIVLSLAVISMLVTFTTGFESDPSLGMICFTLIGMIALGFVISILPLNLRKYLPYVIGLLALIPIGAKANFQGFEVIWDAKVALFAVLGSLIPLIASIKTSVAKKLFQADEEYFSTGVSLVLFGISIFAASFFVSTFGLVLLATGYFSTNLALRSNKGMQMGIVLFSIAWVLFTLAELPEISDSLMKGNLWMGILVGFGAIWISRSLIIFKNAVILSLILPIGIIALVASFGLLNENFGGMPTWLGALIGSALALASIDKEVDKPFFSGALIPLILIGFTFSVHSFLQPEKLEVETLIQSTEKENSPKQGKKDVMSLPAIALTEGDAGAWKSVAANSKLEFELGPAASRTAGAFKNFKVDLQLDQFGKMSNLNVEMESSSLTTFNPIRDESVLSDEFIQSAKFPKVTYVSKSIEKVGEDYKIEGELEFVGQKVSKPVTLRFVSKIDKDGKQILVFVGKSVVDRTKHAMSSDPKIGDLVDVTFEVAVTR